MAAIVIADASPLIALARVGGLSWLQTVSITTTDPALSHNDPALLQIDERSGRAVAQDLGLSAA